MPPACLDVSLGVSANLPLIWSNFLPFLNIYCFEPISLYKGGLFFGLHGMSDDELNAFKSNAEEISENLRNQNFFEKTQVKSSLRENLTYLYTWVI